MTATELRAAIEAQEFDCETVVRESLRRIAEREPDVQAWQFLDAEGALARASALDEGSEKKALAGIPVGIKDIIDTVDMPTEQGTPIHRGARPVRDAACVATLRNAGAIVLGKTVTTEFANFTPGKTRNPHDPRRTPGGSSSGSAAAVAAGMVPLAMGTQTTASVIRPASYCGVYGYRPTYGEMSCSGVMEASHSLDTIGLFARSLDDIGLFREAILAIHHEPILKPPSLRIGFCRTPLWTRVEPECAGRIEGAVRALSGAGADVKELALPPIFDELPDAHRWISSFEFVRSHAAEINDHLPQISERLRKGRIADGLSCSFERYREALCLAERARAMFDELTEPFDVLVTAASTGEAPIGLDTTGDASMCIIWTAMYTPAISLPALHGQNGLPLGLQVIGKRHADLAALGAASWIDSALSARGNGTTR